MVGGSTTKTGRHEIAEILLKMALNTNNLKNWERIASIDSYMLFYNQYCSNVFLNEVLCLYCRGKPCFLLSLWSVHS
jgi:hypothetical protein